MNIFLGYWPRAARKPAPPWMCLSLHDPCSALAPTRVTTNTHTNTNTNTNTQTHKHTNTQTHKHTNIQRARIHTHTGTWLYVGDMCVSELGSTLNLLFGCNGREECMHNFLLVRPDMRKSPASWRCLPAVIFVQTIKNLSVSSLTCCGMRFDPRSVFPIKPSKGCLSNIHPNPT